MVIDSSALLAILLDEPEARRMIAAIDAAPRRLVGASAAVEAAVVMLARKGPQGEIALDALMLALGIEVVPMQPTAVIGARSAYARYGKGVGAPAVLNYGDCLSYGVSADLGEPLLFKGDDFAATDVVAAEY
jgi:ribonuclease VapC